MNLAIHSNLTAPTCRWQLCYLRTVVLSSSWTQRRKSCTLLTRSYSCVTSATSTSPNPKIPNNKPTKSRSLTRALNFFCGVTWRCNWHSCYATDNTFYETMHLLFSHCKSCVLLIASYSNNFLQMSHGMGASLPIDKAHFSLLGLRLGYSLS